ncbi:MAG: tetratricopeptide repeat protein [Pseudomonadota bacterium]
MAAAGLDPVVATPAHGSLDALFVQATDDHEAGKLDAAEQAYRKILEVDPAHPEANHNLGLLAAQCGQAAAGLPFLHRAVELDPDSAPFWTTLAESLLESGQIETLRHVEV